MSQAQLRPAVDLDSTVDLGSSEDRDPTVDPDSTGEPVGDEIDYLTLEQQLCFALAVASRSVIALYRPLLEPLGLTHPQYLVMVALWQNRSLSVKEISALLQVESPSVSPVLKRLESAGLIERHRDVSDERSVRLTLTPRGRALKDEAGRIPMAMVNRLGMSIPELEGLRETLTQVIQHARDEGAGPGGQPTESSPR